MNINLIIRDARCLLSPTKCFIARRHDDIHKYIYTPSENSLHQLQCRRAAGWVFNAHLIYGRWRASEWTMRRWSGSRCNSAGQTTWLKPTHCAHEMRFLHSKDFSFGGAIRFMAIELHDSGGYASQMRIRVCRICINSSLHLWAAVLFKLLYWVFHLQFESVFVICWLILPGLVFNASIYTVDAVNRSWFKKNHDFQSCLNLKFFCFSDSMWLK
jgi:hypothetical protein